MQTKGSSKFWLVPLMLLFCMATFAKTDKIKYNKYLIYEGFVFNDNPSGKGVLSCLNPEDKDEALFTISGNFSSNEVQKAVVETKAINGLKLTYQSVRYDISIDNDKNVKLTLSPSEEGDHLVELFHDKITDGNEHYDNILVENFIISLLYTKASKLWSVKYGNEVKDSAEFIASLPISSIPTELDQFGYNKGCFDVYLAKVNVSDASVKVNENQICFKDNAYYTNGILYFPKGSGAIAINSNDWYGGRKFANGLSVKKNQDNTYIINNSNGDVFKGTIKNQDMAKTLGYNADAPKIEYLDGELTSNGKTETWIGGESFSARHKRLLAEYDEDLVTSLENGTMTEEQVAKEQSDRFNKWCENLKSFYADKVRVYELNGPGETSEETASKMAGDGIDPDDFTFHYKLTLKPDHTGVFVFEFAASESAYQNQRIHYKRDGSRVRHGDYVAELAGILHDNCKGSWSIEKDKIKFFKDGGDGDPFEFEIFEDGEIVKIDLIELCTLKLISK